MSDLPTGTVTLLFTDIEGSTRLVQHLGTQYSEVLSECRSLLRSAFQRYHGHEVDTQGDAFFVAFARATDAIAAAVACQRALFTHAWPAGVMLRVRIGLHTGEPQRSAEGYVGLDVHHACIGYLGHLFGKITVNAREHTFTGCKWTCGSGKMEGQAPVRPPQHEQQCIFLKEQFILILSPLKRLVGPLVRGLRARFLQSTKPLTSSLPLQTLADLGQSKSELVAENALLRQQLIILKRQVKRPACTKMDRVLLVFLARVVRTWKQALFIVQTETRLALASSALPPLLEAQIKGLISQTEGSGRNDRLDQTDGERESPSSVPSGFVGN